MTKKLMALILAAALTANVSAAPVNFTEADLRQAAEELAEVAKEEGKTPEELANIIVSQLKDDALIGGSKITKEQKQMLGALLAGVALGIVSTVVYNKYLHNMLFGAPAPVAPAPVAPAPVAPAPVAPAVAPAAIPVAVLPVAPVAVPAAVDVDVD